MWADVVVRKEFGDVISELGSNVRVEKSVMTDGVVAMFGLGELADEEIIVLEVRREDVDGC